MRKKGLSRVVRAARTTSQCADCLQEQLRPCRGRQTMKRRFSLSRCGTYVAGTRLDSHTRRIVSVALLLLQNVRAQTIRAALMRVSAGYQAAGATAGRSGVFGRLLFSRRMPCNTGAEPPSQIGEARRSALTMTCFHLAPSRARCCTVVNAKDLRSRVLSDRLILSVTKVVPFIVRDEEKYG